LGGKRGRRWGKEKGGLERMKKEKSEITKSA
jgi:hypothetical protein